MDVPTKEQFTSLIKAVRVKPRLARELRFTPEEVLYPEVREMLAITTRGGQEGVLLVNVATHKMDSNAGLKIIPFELSNRITDTRTGRSRSITCDLCYTWQAGSNATRITCMRTSTKTNITLLVCADLNCSLHVRNLTPQAILSRAQLHEDIMPEGRIRRFRHKLEAFLNTLDA